MAASDQGAAPPDADGASTDSSPETDAAQVVPAEPDPAEAEASDGTATDVAPEETPATAPPTGSSAPPRPTAAGRVWVALVVGVILVVLLIIFIAENSGAVTVSFLGAHGRISLGLAMLGAAVVGAVVTLLVGTTRILQLRREVRRNARKL